MATVLLIIHGLVAVALLGAITHQTLAAWAPPSARPRSFFGRFRAVASASFANAIVVLYTVSALLGAILYLDFRVEIRPDLERAGSFAFAYGTAFAVLYAVALKLDLALFTVYPSLGVVLLGTRHSGDVAAPSMAFLAPAMYWYGWTATAALGALMVGLVAAFFPERWTQRFWLGWLWVVPTAAMIACVYLTLPWFRL